MSETAAAGAPVVYPELAGRVVMITGAASGLGLEMAHAFAQNGCRLALLDINDHGLRAAQEDLQQAYSGLETASAVCAVNDEAQVAAAFETIEKKWGRLDVLMNNAGISMNCPTLELSGEQWRRAIDINLNGVFYCGQQAARIMVKQGSGVILNISSMYGVVAAPERAAYCATKAAVAMLTKVMAIEFASKGLRVNAIGPGYVRTALVDEVASQGRLDLDALARRTPAGRLGTPREIADLAVFLASDRATFINGHVAVADGGWSAYSYL